MITGLRAALIELEETDFFPLHPGVFIGRGLEKKKIAADDFAKMCKIDPDEVREVIAGRRMPDDTFIEKAKVVFNEAAIAFRAERDEFQYYQQKPKLVALQMRG